MVGRLSNISSRTRFLVLRRDGFRCVYCGRSSADVALHIDHVEPKAKGGPDDLANYVVACQQCNGGKATMSVLGEGTKTKSRPEITVASPGLCGKCFVTLTKDGKLNEQGIIRAKITEEFYLIQYIEWFMGDLGTMKLITLKEMASDRWILFEDAEHINFWKEYGPGRRLLECDDEAA